MAKAQLRTRDGVLPVFERRARGDNRTRGRSLRKPPAGGFYFGAVPNSAIMPKKRASPLRVMGTSGPLGNQGLTGLIKPQDTRQQRSPDLRSGREVQAPHDLVHRTPASDGQEELFFAIKEFRRRNHVIAKFQIARHLRHPSVVHKLDLLHEQQDEGPFFEVMQNCTAGTLSSLLGAAGGPIAHGEAECFFKQLARGVEYLHDVVIAHCHLKPKNLLLTVEGLLKISKFGISQWIGPLEGSGSTDGI
ncbi:serine/threonine-protein kinase hal4 [Apiospora saccharicola]|uniref:Autophagy-related protein 1 n=1 Tax=Apiospora saccharicola TaxID=335842 RepID=A0ABR1V252_9PEZI